MAIERTWVDNIRDMYGNTNTPARKMTPAEAAEWWAKRIGEDADVRWQEATNIKAQTDEINARQNLVSQRLITEGVDQNEIDALLKEFGPSFGNTFDRNTLELAKNNTFSKKQIREYSNQQARDQTMRSLAARGGYDSGEAQYADEQQRRLYMQEGLANKSALNEWFAGQQSFYQQAEVARAAAIHKSRMAAGVRQAALWPDGPPDVAASFDFDPVTKVSNKKRFDSSGIPLIFGGNDSLSDDDDDAPPPPKVDPVTGRRNDEPFDRSGIRLPFGGNNLREQPLVLPALALPQVQQAGNALNNMIAPSPVRASFSSIPTTFAPQPPPKKVVAPKAVNPYTTNAFQALKGFR